MNTQRIFSVLDRLAHHSTTGEDLNNTVAGLRRLLTDEKGVVGVPSEVWPRVLSKASSASELREEITALREKLRQATLSEHDQSRQIEALIEQIAKLQLQLDALKPEEISSDFYTRAQVKQIIATLFEKDHGVCKALVEKNARQRRSGADLPKITDSLLQQWQRRNQYPAWMVEQLRLMTPDDLLKGHKWTAEHKAFLIERWLADPQQTNEQLADLCSQSFGVKITDSSIRGVLNRAGLLRPKS